MAVVINLVPFVYVSGPDDADTARWRERRPATGTLVTMAGIVAVFLPTGEAGDVWARGQDGGGVRCRWPSGWPTGGRAARPGLIH